ncbi:MAG: hypothetical protein HC852_01185 [Acaryochloridaceae cyanobacterium RU_4_10]|nr:hypothetical protein [Acaryochloridaceae cyanobacterium RU_4_10]
MKIVRFLAKSSGRFYILALIAVLQLQAIALPKSPAKVPGTSVRITPPEGFQPSQLFSGFEQKTSGASIVVVELPVPKEAIPKTLTQLGSPEALKSKGMRVIESKDITIAERPGKLLLVSQTAQGIPFLKWIAVLNEGDRILIVTAPFPESRSTALREPLRQAIMTVSWKASSPDRLLEGLPFSFQTYGDLKVSGRISNTVILTKNGAKSPIPPSDPLLVLGSAYSQVQIEDLGKFSRTRLKQTPEVKDLVEISGQPTPIAGQKAFELVARGYDLRTNKPLTVYQVIIATDKTYYIVQGMVPNTSAQDYLPIFRSVAKSVVLKN